MEEFLVVYDYGMGGLWAYVRAPSAESIETEYPELKIISERPSWLTPDHDATLDRLEITAPSGLLADILNHRE